VSFVVNTASFAPEWGHSLVAALPGPECIYA
jgi:hypothetical protein